MKEAAGYLRRSTDRQEQSIEDQRKTILNYAAENDFEVIHFYIDDAVSGSTTEGRKDFLRLMDDAQKEDCPFRYVLVYDVKRFGRVDNDEAGHYRFLLRQHGIEVIYASENFTGDDTDDLIRPVKQWQARQESKDLSKVTIRGLLSLSEGGWWLGGVPPYGYDLLYCDSLGKPYMVVRFVASGDKEIYDVSGKLQRVIPRGERFATSEKDKVRLVLSTPDRVSLIKRIYDLYVSSGMGFKSIADVLNREGIPSPRNGNWSRNTHAHWSTGTIRTILMNGLYTGDMIWNRRACGKFHRIENGFAKERLRRRANKVKLNGSEDWIVIPNAHEPIVDRHTFDRAQEIRLKRPRRGRNRCGGRGKASPFLLSGLISCESCGHSFQGLTMRKSKRRKDGTQVQTRYYVCGGYMTKGNAVCERVLFRKEHLEEFVLDGIRRRISKYLSRGGKSVLKKFIAEELQGGRRDPREEIAGLRSKLEEIDKKADVLLDNISAANRDFIDRKLARLRSEKRTLEVRLEELEAIDYKPVDVRGTVDEILRHLSDFDSVFAEGSIEEKKEFIRSFVAKIKLSPEECRGRVQFFRIPLSGNGNSSFAVVAGVGFEPTTFGL